MGKQIVQEQFNSQNFMFLDFLKLYFKRPNEAAKLGAQNKDKISMLICAVVFILANGFAQLAVGIKAHFYKPQLFFFGVLFGIFGLIVPACLNMLASITSGNRDIKKRESFGKCILHTPMTSLFLIFAFLIGSILPLKVAIFLYPLIISLTLYVYTLSYISVLREALSDTMLGKIIAFGTIILYVILLGILLIIEIVSVGDAVVEAIYSLVYGGLDSLLGSLI